MTAILQRILPRYAITRFFGILGDTKIKPVKNILINLYIKLYRIDLSQAVGKSAKDFESFNDFFSRKLKFHARSITTEDKAIASPVDGTIYAFGTIGAEEMFTAKGFQYSLKQLSVRKDFTDPFKGGEFLCMYLSPKDYHRVHMPVKGTLKSMLYVPGDYFSVNPKVIKALPGVFTKNERLICYFETALGPLLYIMIGAMNVSSLNTAWVDRVNACRKGELIYTDYERAEIVLEKGDEVGYFAMGSTVIILFPPKRIRFDDTLKSHQHCLYGEKIGMINL